MRERVWCFSSVWRVEAVHHALIQGGPGITPIRWFRELNSASPSGGLAAGNERLEARFGSFAGLSSGFSRFND